MCIVSWLQKARVRGEVLLQEAQAEDVAVQQEVKRKARRAAQAWRDA